MASRMSAKPTATRIARATAITRDRLGTFVFIDIYHVWTAAPFQTRTRLACNDIDDRGHANMLHCQSPGLGVCATGWASAEAASNTGVNRLVAMTGVWIDSAPALVLQRQVHLIGTMAGNNVSGNQRAVGLQQY